MNSEEINRDNSDVSKEINQSLKPSLPEEKHSSEHNSEYTSLATEIPELASYDGLIIKKFLKKFGKFSKPNSLTNKERKFLKKLKTMTENEKFKKNKFRAKRFRSQAKMSESNCKVRVAFDLSYFNEELMKYVDMRMSIKQIHRCYSENRRLKDPLQFHITSVDKQAKAILSNNAGYENWDVHFHEESYLNAFQRDEIIYLTSESNNVIEKFEDCKVYIIGGLLDHNSMKGLSYNRAIANNVSHARLPIDMYLNMKSLKVLPINQVFSIISLVVQGKTWTEALIEVIPQRKEAVVKTVTSS